MSDPFSLNFRMGGEKRITRQTDASKTNSNENIESKVKLLEQNMMENVNELKKLIGSRSRETSSSGELSTEELLLRIQEFEKTIGDAISSIKTELKDLNYRFSSLEKKSDNRQYRHNGFVVSGLKENAESTPETLKKQIVDVIKCKIKISVSENDIDFCYRLGAKNEGRIKPRPTAVIFVNKWKRDTVFINKKLLKGSGIVFTEILTQEKQQLYSAACEKYGVKNCWSWKGEIFVSENGKKKQIKNGDSI